MSDPFKQGDIVVCDNTGTNCISIGKEYQVIGINTSNHSIKVLNDIGVTDWYYTSRFVFPKNALLSYIARAQSYVGKGYTLKSGNKKSQCTQVRTYLHESQFKYSGGDVGSINAKDMFRELGFAVVIGNGYEEFDIRDVLDMQKCVEIVLSPQYTAMVYADKVIVGCQTISKDLIRQIYETQEGLSS